MSSYVRQTGPLGLPVATWIALSAVALLFIAMIIGAPLAKADGSATFSPIIYRTFSHLCHQLPDRSFFIAGHPFAVCSRCTGIYFGFGLAALVYPLFRSLRQVTTPYRKWLFLAAAPLGIDWSLEFFGIWNNTHSSRLLTGALLGATAVFFIMPGLMDLSLRDWKASKVATKPRLTTTTLPTDSTPSDYSAPHRRI